MKMMTQMKMKEFSFNTTKITEIFVLKFEMKIEHNRVGIHEKGKAVGVRR